MNFEQKYECREDNCLTADCVQRLIGCFFLFSPLNAYFRNNAIADYLSSNGFKEALEAFKREAQTVGDY